MLAIDPLRLARRQLELDRERTGRYPHLLRHKADRMTASPLALLRGAAPLFYELLEAHPTLAEGPPGEGWLVGDCHLENFGAFRTGALSVKETRASHATESVVFDLNDFDDTFVGPWRFDVVRLATSLLLGGREIGLDGQRALSLCDALLEAYVGAAFHRRKTRASPPCVSSLIEQVRTRTRGQLLDARTRVVRGERRFVRGPRYESLPRKLRAKAERAFAKYVKRLPEAERPPPEAVEVIDDAAFRIAGTGSLGCVRIALLARGKGGADGGWIFDMKEEDSPSAACLIKPPKLEPAERVATGLRACVAHPPRMIGTTRLRGSSMFVRRLAPQEDKLDWTTLHERDLEPLSRHLGALLGAAHRRGAKRARSAPWTDDERTRLLGNAISLAGIHEAMYLAYCQLVRR
ncbi:MAG TPA: DUF2252 family protein [Polyangiaceae bacterium]|jgi:uncharacterized protein (DUF2252 family)